MAKKKKKSGFLQWILGLFLFFGVLYAILYFSLNNSYWGALKKNVRPSRPNKSTTASNYSIHGIDISRYQQKIDWDRVKNSLHDGKKISFVFAKATEGYSLKDPYFDYNSRNVRRHGIAFGAYHFFNPRLDPRRQAEFFIETYRAQTGDLPPVVDIEKTGNMTSLQIRQNLEVFLDILENHYGTRPIIYTYLNFYKRYLHPSFEGYKFWIAHYYRTQLFTPPGLNWIFWQYADNAEINGILGDVDINVFKGNAAELEALRRK